MLTSLMLRRKAMEHFNNSGTECIVLMREGDTALILRLGSDVSYVVPCEHREGASDWWGGRYFDNLEKALACYKKSAPVTGITKGA